jgi:4-hydroxybenzoate polyprenyltransferase
MSVNTESSSAVDTPALSSKPAKSLLIRFGEMVRFSHTLFALPFAVWATVMSLAVPRPEGVSAGSNVFLRCLGILLCMVFARSSAMAFNRWVDADIDAKNPRTATRHIPAGSLTKRQVILFWLANSLGFVLSCLLFWPNVLPVILSVPVLLLLCGYSYTKRFTALCHVWLGVSLMLAPVCAWIAMRGEVVQVFPTDILPAVFVGLSVLFWVTGFDIIYALQDETFDRSQGLHSIPAWLGVKNSLRLAAGLHVVMVILLVGLAVLFPQLSLGWIYLSVVALIASLLVWEHRLANPQDLLKLNIAFFQINIVISFLLMTAGIIDSLT